MFCRLMAWEGSGCWWCWGVNVRSRGVEGGGSVVVLDNMEAIVGNDARGFVGSAVEDWGQYSEENVGGEGSEVGSMKRGLLVVVGWG